jgi:hypothetical protein
MYREEAQKWLSELIHITKEIAADDAWDSKATDFV